MTQPGLGMRMKEARLRARPKLSQEKIGKLLAKAIGRAGGDFTASAVGQWELGKSEPSHAAVKEWVRITGADYFYITVGRKTEQLEGSGRLPRGGRLVPRTTALLAIAERLSGAPDDVVHTHFDCSERAFLIPIFDNRNTDTYREGDNVVIDPAEKPIPGDMVLAKIDAKPVFGVYAERKGGSVEIEAINKLWQTVSVLPKRGDKVIGVMTEHAKPRRQA